MADTAPIEAENDGDDEKGGFRVRLAWPMGNNGPVTYANQFAISQTGEMEFVLEFGQMLLTGYFNRTKEEIEAGLEGMEDKARRKDRLVKDIIDGSCKHS